MIANSNSVIFDILTTGKALQIVVIYVIRSFWGTIFLSLRFICRSISWGRSPLLSLQAGGSGLSSSTRRCTTASFAPHVSCGVAKIYTGVMYKENMYRSCERSPLNYNQWNNNDVKHTHEKEEERFTESLLRPLPLCSESSVRSTKITHCISR